MPGNLEASGWEEAERVAAGPAHPSVAESPGGAGGRASRESLPAVPAVSHSEVAFLLFAAKVAFDSLGRFL